MPIEFDLLFVSMFVWIDLLNDPLVLLGIRELFIDDDDDDDDDDHYYYYCYYYYYYYHH